MLTLCSSVCSYGEREGGGREKITYSGSAGVKDDEEGTKKGKGSAVALTRVQDSRNPGIWLL